MSASHYFINEEFTSVQGEGRWTGRVARFIRLQGCTVGCSWCDSGPLADLKWGRFTNGLTRNTWGRGGVFKPTEEIVSGIDTYHVVITGGEPTLYNLDLLLTLIDLMPGDHYTQLETSGQNNLKGHLRPDWITWSPKQNLNWDAPERLKAQVSEVKWVVDEPLQWETVMATWQWYMDLGTPPPPFYLMPEGCPPRKEMIDKTLSWLHSIENPLARVRFFFGDRLQYRLGVR